MLSFCVVAPESAGERVVLLLCSGRNEEKGAGGSDPRAGFESWAIYRENVAFGPFVVAPCPNDLPFVAKAPFHRSKKVNCFAG